jgi:type I restriction enzyme S subunit
VKAGWTTKTLADVCTVFADGDWIESKDQSTDGIRLIQTGNVGEGEFKDRSDKARYISEETFARLRCTEIYEGDCLISRLPDPVGRSAILPDTGERMITAVDCTIVRFDQTLCLPTFFNYYSQSTEYINNIAERCTGTTRNRISRSQLGNTTLPIPSIKEQHRIVTLLDEAFADIATAKANAEKNLQNARELFDNALQSLVDGTSNDWTQRTMAEVCDITSKLVDPREDHYLDLPHVGAGNIESKTSALVDVKTAREENLISGKFLFDESMVLYSKIRPYLMKVVRPDFNGLCSADIYPLAPKPDIITRDYLYYLLLAPTFTEYAIKGSARAGMPKVNREHLFAYQFLLPKVQDQKRITENLDQIANETIRLESIYRQKLTALDDLKKSLLHQAFSGQL